MKTMRMTPLANALKFVTWNGLNHDQSGVIDPGCPWPTLTSATVDSASSMTSSMPSRATQVIATIYSTPTSSTQPLEGFAPMPSALNRKNTYWPATWARLAMTSTSAAMIAQPPAQPDLGPNARVAQVNVVPQSGSALFSSL